MYLDWTISRPTGPPTKEVDGRGANDRFMVKVPYHASGRSGPNCSTLNDRAAVPRPRLDHPTAHMPPARALRSVASSTRRPQPSVKKYVKRPGRPPPPRSACATPRATATIVVAPKPHQLGRIQRARTRSARRLDSALHTTYDNVHLRGGIRRSAQYADIEVRDGLGLTSF